MATLIATDDPTGCSIQEALTLPIPAPSFTTLWGLWRAWGELHARSLTGREPVGHHIFVYRIRRGYSRARLATRSCLNSSYLLRVERQLREGMRHETALRLSEALGLSDIECGRLFVAAGLAPPVLMQSGWDSGLQQLAGYYARALHED